MRWERADLCRSFFTPICCLMIISTMPAFAWQDALTATLVFLIFSLLVSLLAEPRRQQAMAILVAGASGVYFNGGLSIWEYAFAGVVLLVAYGGLRSYAWLGVGWLLHTSWDVLHHFHGTPIIALVPLSSAQCALCDALIAGWFFGGAPSVYAVAARLWKQPASQH
jgi:hypothetical protein